MLVHVIGINLCQYLYDWLIFSPSHDQWLQDTVQVLNLYHTMDLLIHYKKLELIPKQKFIFLWYQFDLISFQVTTTLDRYQKSNTDLLIPAKPRRMCSYVADPAQSLVSTEKMVPVGRLHIREAQHCMSQHWDFNVLTSNLLIPLFPTAEEDFQWWKSAQCSEGSPSYPDRTRHSVVHRCIEHWLGNTLECIDGVRCMDNNRGNTSHQRARVRSHTQSHAPLTAEAYGSDSPGCVRQLHYNVMSYINKQGGIRSIQLCRPTKKLLLVSGQPNSTPGTTHPHEIERPCRHSVTPFPDVRYNMVSTSTCLQSTRMGNPIIGSDCNEVESQTSTICVPCFRSINHDSRWSVNELEGSVGIRIPTTNSVTTVAWEGPTGPVRTDPHCPILAPVVPTTL